MSEATRQRPVFSGGWVKALLGLIVLACFLPVLHADFVFDDFKTITPNLAVRDFSELLDKCSPRFAAQLGETTYRPLTTLTYLLTYAIAGARPAVHHAVDLLLHLLTVLMLHALLLRLGLPAPAAGFGSLLFGLHPLASGVVAMISFREEPLVAVCGLGALLLLVGSTSRPRAAAACGLLFLAPFVKETGIAFAALPFFLPDRQGWARWRRALWCGASGGSAMVALLAINRFVTQGLALSERTVLSGPQRVIVAGQAVAAYAERLVFWRGLSPLHDDAPAPETLTPAVVFGLVLLVLLLVALGREVARPRRPLLGLGAGLVLFPLVPTLNLLLPFWVKQADRFCYVPLLALGLTGAAAGAWVLRHSARARWAGAAGGVALLALFFLATQRELPRYHDNYALFGSVVRRQPDSLLGKLYFAQELIERRQDAAAQPLLRAVLERFPANLKALNALAETEIHLGAPQRAIQLLEPAPLVGVDGPSAAITLQAAYLTVGDLAAAVRLTRQWVDQPELTTADKQVLLDNLNRALQPR